MESLKSLKRDFTTGLALSVLALAIAVAWGSPFVGPRAAYAEGAQTQAERQQVPSQAAQAGSAQTSKEKPHPGTQQRVNQQ